MGKYMESRNGVRIYEHEPRKYRGIENISSVTADGMIFRLYVWLRENGVEETIEDVDNNTSGIREGNEIHIHDDYRFDYDESELYISYLYYHNEMVWAVLIDKANDSWYGEFEL